MILNTRKNSGFTLIEAVIVLGLFVLLSSMSWLTLSNYLAVTALDQTANQIVLLLQDAQSRAIAGDASSVWGVAFENDATSDTATLFRASQSNDIKTITLRQNIMFVDPGSGETRSVTFAKLTGMPSKIFTVTLGIVGRSVTRVIEIDEFGVITGLGTGQYRGLVGYWKFDEVEGDGASTTTPDSIGDNDGTLTNGPALDTGIKNDAMSFDGTDDYVEVLDTDWNIANAWTISVWYKQTSAANDKGILQIGNDMAAPEANNFKLVSNYVYVSDDAGSVIKYYTDIPTFTDTWTYVTATWDGTNLKVYQNGVDITDPLTKNIDLAGSMDNTDRPLHIGADWNSGLATAFDGFIDEARVYNRALEADEIERIYYRDKLAYGLVGFWRFNEGTSTVAYDSSGERNNGVLTPDPDGPTWLARGRSGKALSFDGADDYVDADSDTSLDVSNEVTISLWINHVTSIGGYETLITKRDGAAANYEVSLNTGDNLVGFYNGSTFAISNIVLPLNKWHHLAVVTDATESLFYLDGTLEDTVAGGIGATNAGPLYIGAETSGPGQFFDGTIDEVRIYNRALSAGEVDYLNSHPSGQ